MPFLRSDLNNGILLLTIDRPRANAFNLELIGELQTAFKQAARDAQTRIIVLTGAGRVFGAGQDIEEIRAGGETLSFRQHLLETYNPLVLQMRQIEKPVIAAINGPCAGASLGVALACDIRFAADTAKFVVGFTGIGLAPDSGVYGAAPRCINRAGPLASATSCKMSGAAAHLPLPGSSANFGGRPAPIRGGRRAPLVESAFGTRGTHPFFG